MTIRPAITLLTTLLVLTFAACSSNDSNPADNGGGDTTPPAVSNVTTIDGSHIDITFSENLKRETAERRENYVIVEQVVALFAATSPAANPGDTLQVAVASLGSDQRTVSLSTSGQTNGAPYDVTITGVTDLNGNKITSPVVGSFTGSGDPDVTAPEIADRSPAPNATGVGVGQPVVIQFSEYVNYGTVIGGLTWTSSGGAVSFQIENDGVRFALQPNDPLETATEYTVSLSGVQDNVGNTMPLTTWSFTTTPITDTTPPRLVSTSPANKATYVSVNANLSVTFSEAINQTQLMVRLVPDAGDGVASWTNGGKTVTFDPNLPLLSNQQYTLSILPGDVRDLAGNGNVEPATVTFTTGAALESGSFAGTLTGDPGTAVSDPTGATVIAPNASPFRQESFDVLGSDVVAGNNTYDIRYLPDGVYWPIAAKNTNGDDQLDPSTGDAVGAYGVNIGTGDMEQDSLIIAGGRDLTGIDFPMFDPNAIVGTIGYQGQYAQGFYNVAIGVFDTTGFTGPGGQPVYSTETQWPNGGQWHLSSLDGGLADGTYYVGAYMDVNGNQQLDLGVDPIGFYGGASPTPVHVANGSDALGIEIALQDPLTASASRSVAWPAPKHAAPWV